MDLKPSSLDELKSALAAARRDGTRIRKVDLAAFNKVLAHTPEDMTVTVQTGVTLEALQAVLRSHGQWLPIDPPEPGTVTIGQILARDLSGPRRFGHGTIREHLLGIRVLLASGELIKAGGQVVKNVAGYDLCKLFVGDRGSLGIAIEATFKVLPTPEKSLCVGRRYGDIREACGAVRSILASAMTPTVLDVHSNAAGKGGVEVVVCIEGTREDVQWQFDVLIGLGISEAASLDYDGEFRGEGRNPDGPEIRFVSVLPSRLEDELKRLDADAFVARAGNGAVWYRGGIAQVPPAMPVELMRRLKSIYDPDGILPEYSA